MWLIAGLGNPGAKYASHRHNIGFMAADEIVRRHSFRSWQSKFSSLISEGSFAGQKVMIIKPQTFMNKSGSAVAAAMQFYKISPDQLWVFHDELDLDAGRFRLKNSGGHGGHNGLRDISRIIGNQYGRIRMGIGHPGDKNRVASYVLNDFPKSDQSWLNAMIDHSAEHINLLLNGDQASYMNKVSLAIRPYLPVITETKN